MIALVAGGPPVVAVRLAVAMFCLQAAIGAANDLHDVEADRGRKPGKPIPAGLVAPSTARGILLIALASGVGLSALSGPAVLALAVVGSAVGFAYDLRLSGTRWSWLPFALGIPLLPVYAWLGGSGGLPGSFGLLVPLAVVAGTALACSNALADIERDRLAGTATIATALGARATWRLAVVCQTVVVLVALATVLGREDGWAAGGAIAAVLVIAAGLGLARSADPWRRERGWELQGLGLGLLAIVWLVGMAPSPRG